MNTYVMFDLRNSYDKVSNYVVNSVFNKQKIMLSFTLVVIVKTFVLLISQANIFQKIGNPY